MDVKDAVKSAKAYLADLFAEENLFNLGLEEIEHDDVQDAWNVTLGFSRPWDNTTSPLRVLTMDTTPAPRRVYRVVKVRESDGKVLSVKKLEAVD